ncbi:MAG: GNAT family N-acetyltransferase [Burkholderiaceae bacterium]
MSSQTLSINRLSLGDPEDRAALCQLLNEFAASDNGGGEAMSQDVLAQLPDQLAACPTYIGLLAKDGHEPLGLLNAFWSVSSFKARPLINIHDVTVTANAQSRGIGRQMMNELERIGRQMQCCKITLEVLDGNTRASALYERLGFEFYQLDPSYGRARLMQKILTDE